MATEAGLPGWAARIEAPRTAYESPISPSPAHPACEGGAPESVAPGMSTVWLLMR